MAKKLSITKISEALERASRVATAGDPEERSGRFLASPEAPGQDQTRTTDEVVIYQSADGPRISLRHQGDTLWVTQDQIRELFGTTRQNVSAHLRNIYAEGELEKTATSKEILEVRQEGNRSVSRTVPVYNLDAVISVGYRTSSKQATMFRIWATQRLVEFALKGFTLDDARLKNSQDNDHFQELRERIKDIRASEANVYRDILAICSLCVDYDPKSKASQNFFAYSQNKLLWATTSMTAPELILYRADATKDNMGITALDSAVIKKSDAKVAKNYLAPPEIKELNRITVMLLDFFEDQTERRESVSMQDLENALDRFLKFNDRSVLKTAGSVSRAAADAHASAEYEKFAALRRFERHKLDGGDDQKSPARAPKSIAKKGDE